MEYEGSGPKSGAISWKICVLETPKRVLCIADSNAFSYNSIARGPEISGPHLLVQNPNFSKIYILKNSAESAYWSLISRSVWKRHKLTKKPS